MQNRLIRRGVLAVFVAGLLTVAASVPASAACLSKAETRSLVSSGAVLRLAALRGKIKDEIVNARLCERNGHFFYRVTVLDANGAVSRLRFDAKTGARLGGK